MNSKKPIPGRSSKQMENVEKYKSRMLSYANPVEFVNNMYGCHPAENGRDYFLTIFK
jgi:hypothetical protein